MDVHRRALAQLAQPRLERTSGNGAGEVVVLGCELAQQGAEELRLAQRALQSPRDIEPGDAAGFAGRTRYTLLEYEAVLANASIGIAFTRERRCSLCNPRFAEMFGYINFLRSTTSGRGTFSMEFAHYAEVPAGLVDKLMEKEETKLWIVYKAKDTFPFSNKGAWINKYMNALGVEFPKSEKTEDPE